VFFVSVCVIRCVCLSSGIHECDSVGLFEIRLSVPRVVPAMQVHHFYLRVIHHSGKEKKKQHGIS